MIKRILSLFFSLSILSLSFTQSGCTTLKKAEYDQYGYHGEAVVREGMQFAPVDFLGNFFGFFDKLLLFNWDVKRHHPTDKTKVAIERYLKAHGDTLGDVQVDLNRWAPHEDFYRLFTNKRVAWPYRYTLGLISVLVGDVLLNWKVLGRDCYNPYTHTVHLYSDLPSIALHELGHAQDLALRRYRGSYAFLRWTYFFMLYQEWKANNIVFNYLKEPKPEPLQIESDKIQIEAFKILYPAYGTYWGGPLGALLMHIGGRADAENFEQSRPWYKKPVPPKVELFSDPDFKTSYPFYVPEFFTGYFPPDDPTVDPFAPPEPVKQA